MTQITEKNILKTGIAQIAPVWLNKEGSTKKIKQQIELAAAQHCELLVFGEGILPGYPFWLSMTHASAFNEKAQKEIHAHYIRNAIDIEAGDLDSICDLAASKKISIYLGTIERAANRGGHSLYCSLVFISAMGKIESVHRKLQPTYEERLSWSPGDGNGLRVHKLEPFTVGGLNCWENWMPLSRTALYGLGEDLHVAVWPGAERNTVDITKFIAKEARSFVISASGIMRREDFPKDTPHLDLILANAPEWIADGGSCIAGPDGEWVVAPVTHKEDLITAEINFNRVLEERHNFDPVGHYSRPDITRLIVNRERQSLVDFNDEDNKA